MTEPPNLAHLDSTFGGAILVAHNTSVLEALVLTSLVQSKADAKRALKAGQVRLNSYLATPITQDQPLTLACCLNSERLWLLKGKEVRMIHLVSNGV